MRNDEYDLPKRRDALAKAIKLCGGQIAFAAKLTDALKLSPRHEEPRVISQQIVSYWLSSSPFGVPEKFCIEIEELSDVNFQVTKHLLRPDIFDPMPYEPIAA